MTIPSRAYSGIEAIMKRILAVFLLLSCLLASCSGNKSIALTYSDGAYRNGNKTAYLEAPVTYYALTALDESAYATIKRTGMDDILLYPIENVSTAEYLADANLNLYYAEGAELPTLATLGANKIALYQYSETRVARQLEATLTDATAVAALVRYATDESIERLPASLVTAELYHRMELLFLNTSFSAFGIMLEYRKFSVDVSGMGKNFIYNRIDGTYTPVGDVLEDYFLADVATDTAEE